MPTSFELAHREDVLGTVTTVDRLIVHGHLQAFWFKDGLAFFLNRQGVRIGRDFGRYVL